MRCGDVRKVILRRMDSEATPSYYIHRDDVFDVVKRAHISTGHGGRDKMMKALQPKYANISRDIVGIYKGLCEECVKRPKQSGVVMRPILVHEYGSRGQVDLIDMQSMPYHGHKWILVYHHFTKYCVLRPLQSKRTAEVASQLMDIFLLLGAPVILQSDNGAEFTAAVIEELKLLWPDLLIVHGKPRHPQSQGSVERLNSDVKDMLVAWLADNQSTAWPSGLKFVQFQKNSSFHSGINQSPYECLFGMKPQCGLRSTPLPDDVLQTVITEDDLARLAPINIATETQQGIIFYCMYKSVLISFLDLMTNFLL